MRSLIAFALVLHYLLMGVMGGAWATRQRAEAPSAAHPYVHSVLCQSHNYLRLDCFDACHGKQSGHLLQQIATGDDHADGIPQLLAKATLDVHLLAAPLRLPAAPHYALTTSAPGGSPAPAVVAGNFSLEGPPPRA